MGIDALDLAFRLEKSFGIDITRNEAYVALFHTVGNLHRYLVDKLRRRKTINYRNWYWRRGMIV